MKKLLLALLFSAWASAAAGQAVTALGPITPGNCASFNSPTVIKDSGAVCGGGGGGGLTIGAPITGGTPGTVIINNGGLVGQTPAFTQGSVIFEGPATLAEDNNNFFWDNTNKRLGIGTKTPAANLSIVTQTDSNDSLFHSKYFTSLTSSEFIGRRAYGTEALPTAIAIDTRIAGFGGRGHDGTTFSATADGIFFVTAAETFTPTAHGTYLSWFNTAIGTLTRREYMRLDPGGNLGIGNDASNVFVPAGINNILRLTKTFTDGSTAQNAIQVDIDSTVGGAATSQVRGFLVNIKNSGTTSATGLLSGAFYTVTANGSQNYSTNNFTAVSTSVTTTASQSGTIVDTNALRINAPSFAGTKPTSAFGAHVFNQGVAGSTNSYAYYAEAQSGATNSWAFYANGASPNFFGGSVAVAGCAIGASAFCVTGASAFSDGITALTVALNGCTIGANAFCATGTANISGNLTLGSAAFLGWSTDLFLFRDAANTLAQRNGVNAQIFRIYNTFTDASNGEWFEANWASSIFRLSTKNNGAGGARRFILADAGIDVLYINGGYGPTVRSDFFFGWSANTTINTAADTTLYRSAAGVVGIGTTTSNGLGSLLLTNITASGVIINTGITTDATHTTSTVCQDTTTHQYYFGSAALGVCLGTSGRQFKTAFAPMAAGIDELMKINFQNYRYLPGWGDSGARMQYGPTAQDVEAAIPDIARQDANGVTINYDSGALLFIGLRSIQQLSQKIEALERRISK